MQSLSFASITHPDDVEESRQCVQSLLAGDGKVWDFEKRYLAKDGRVVWARVATRLQRDGDGTPLHFVTHIVDIGDRKRAEEQLRAAMIRLEHLNSVVLAIRAINQLIVRERHPGRLLQRTCDLLVETRGYQGAWAALGEEGHPPTILAQAGWGNAFEPLRRQFADGSWPGCRTRVRSCAQGVVLLEPAVDCRHCPIYISSPHDRAAAMPLCMEGKLVGVLAVTIAGDAPFDDEEQHLLVEVAEDVSFALESIENEGRSRESQRQLARLFETMAQGVVHQDAAGRITEANPAAERILGLSLAEMTGRTSIDPRWRALREDGSEFPGDQHHSMVVLRTGRPSTGFMGVFNPKTGDHRWLHVHAVPETGGDGERPLGAFTTFDDVTELRAAESKARHERDRAQQYLDIAGTMLVAIDREGIVQMINPAGCSILGYPVHEIIGRDWLGTFVPTDWRGAVARLSHAVLANDPDAERNENPVLTRSGEERLIAWTNAAIRDESGSVIGHLSSGEDVTERRRAERLIAARLDLMEYATGHSLPEVLRKTVDEACEIASSPIGFYHFVTPDEKGLILQAWSTRTRAEYCKAEGEGLHYPVERAGVWADCIRKRAPVIHNDYASVEERRGMPEGHAALTRELVVPIFRDGKIVAVLGVGNKSSHYASRDVETVMFLADVAWEVASKKKAEEQLKAVEHQLAQSQRLESVGRLAGGVAHDFNNLLTVINGSAAFVAEGLPDGDPLRDDVQQIAEAGHRAAKLTHQLLAFSRRQVFKPEVLDLNGTIRQMDQMLRRLIGEDIHLRAVLQSDLWPVEAASGQQALDLCEQGATPVDLLVTDVVMPAMSGRQLAESLAKIVPGLKVVYMSGYTDNAIVHHGVLDEGVRLIPKPFTAEAALRTVREALDHVE